MQIPGIYVEIKGDSDHLQKEMRTARSYVQQQSKGISNALNNALSPNQVKSGVNELVRSFKTLNQASNVSSKAFSQIGVDLKEMRHLTGLSERELQKLQTRMLQNRTAKTQQRALRDIARSADLTKKEIAQLGRQFGLTSKQIKTVNAQLGHMPKRLSLVQSMTRSLYANVLALGSVWGAIYGVQALSRISDEYTEINSKLKLVTDSSEEFSEVYQELFDISQETGSSFATNASTFANLALTLKDSSITTGEMLEMFTSLNKSLVVAGAATQEASSFMLQFKQALGSGRLAGQELNAVLESNAYFAGLLAKSIRNASGSIGISIGELKDYGAQGRLTTDIIMEAFPRMSAQIEKDYSKIATTIGRATTELSNAWKDVLADGDKASNASKNVAVSISDLAATITENKETFGNIFEGMITGAGQAVDGIGNVYRSIQGLAVVAASKDKSLIDWIMANPEDMKNWQDEIISGAAFVKDRLAEVRKEIAIQDARFFDWPDKIDKLKSLRNEETRLLKELSQIGARQRALEIAGQGEYIDSWRKPGTSVTGPTNSAAEESKKAAINIPLDPWRIAYDERHEVQSRALQASIDLEKQMVKDGIAAAAEIPLDPWHQAYNQRYEIQSRTLEAMGQKEHDFSDDMKNAMTGWASSWSSSMNDMLWEADTTFDGILESFGKMLSQMVIQKGITEPLMEGVDIAASWFSSKVLHDGGIVGQTSASRSVSSATFTNAPRFHSGLMPNEFPAILQKGEGVFTKDQMKALSPAGSKVTVNVTNNTSADAQVHERQNSDGSIDIEVLIDEAMAKNIGTFGSSSNKAVRAATGSRPQLIRR